LHQSQTISVSFLEDLHPVVLTNQPQTGNEGHEGHESYEGDEGDEVIALQSDFNAGSARVL